MRGPEAESTRLRTPFANVLVILVGLLLVGLAAAHLVVDDDDLWVDFVEVILPFVAGVLVVGIGIHASRRWPAARVRGMALWIVGGGIAGGLGIVWILLIISLETTPAGEPYALFANGIGMGAGAGIVVGSYYVTVQEQTRRLREATERMEDFVSVVNHDLRNPLSVAKGYLELAREEATGDEYFEEIETALDRMEQLTSEVLGLARRQRPTQALEPVAVADVADAAALMVPLGDVAVHVDAQLTVEADPERLQTLFENLYRNAIEHGGPGLSAIRVGDLAAPDGFYVADDGRGIPADQRTRIFEGGYSTRPQGTGFGLSIVRRVVDTHGWTIEVTADADGGARFEIVVDPPVR